MGVCCSRIDENEIDVELSPVVVIETLPDDDEDEDKDIKVTEPPEPVWDNGRPKLTLPVFATPEELARRREQRRREEEEKREAAIKAEREAKMRYLRELEEKAKREEEALRAAEEAERAAIQAVEDAKVAAEAARIAALEREKREAEEKIAAVTPMHMRHHSMSSVRHHSVIHSPQTRQNSTIYAGGANLSPFSAIPRIKVDEQLIAWLKKVPLLAKLTMTELHTLASTLTERTFRNGYKIIVEGDVGHECFIISRGNVRVTKWQTEAKSDAELCILAPGDFVGESALLANANDETGGLTQRGATATAIGQTHCYLLSREKFRALLGKDRLNVQFQKRAAISDTGGFGSTNPLLPSNNGRHNAITAAGPASSATSAPQNAVRTKSAQTASMLMKVVMESVLFANIDEAQRQTIVDSMWLRPVAADEVIIQQGDIGEHWYVIDSGTFDIWVAPKTGGPPAKVSTKERGAGVGELALLYNAPRAATIRANRPGGVWVLDRFTYRTILTQAAEEKRARYDAFLKHVKEFDVLIASERTKLAEALDEISFEPGTPIVTEGEMGDTFYIILSGTVVVSKEKEGELVRLKEGAYFGERSLIKNEPRAATCTALDKVVCVYLKSDAFKGLLGNMDDIFRSRQEVYNAMLADAAKAAKDKDPSASGKDKAAAAAAAAAATTDKAKSKEKEKTKDGDSSQTNTLLTNLKLQDLKVIGTLGKGSFGHVQLVKDKTGATYALKIVSKQAVEDLGQQEHILNEKRTMAQLNHPFLVRLFATFKDADRLYFLLEASLGGELFTLLRAKSSFSEPVARFYAASVVLAFEFMHAKGIIYRGQPTNMAKPVWLK